MKKRNYIVLSLSIIIAWTVSYFIYQWLLSIHANLTLKIFVPTVFFLAISSGLWLMFNLITLFFFQKNGVRGYKLRGKITSYFLLSTLSFILVFGTLMFTLIFLIENTFIDSDSNIADNLLDNYKNIIRAHKDKYETETAALASKDPSLFPVIFRIEGGRIVFIKNKDLNLSGSLAKRPDIIINFFSESRSDIYYSGESYDITIVKHKDLYYCAYTEKVLSDSIKTLDYNLNSITKLRDTKKYILPVSILAIFILAVPILIGVFFVSLAVAKNITVPIEEIAKGIKIISEKNLDYKVKIRSQDEIGDLAYHFNSMATRLKFAYQQIQRMERIEAWQEMARRLAHEVKNPLTPIKLSAERLLYSYEFKPQEFKDILDKTTATIISETKRLEKLVNEFSKFARLPNLKLEKKNIAVTLNDLTVFFQGAYPLYNIIKNITFDELYILYDESQLKQVIINLVNNAIEACEATEKYVEIKAVINEEYLTISVYDKGSGSRPRTGIKYSNLISRQKSREAA